MNFTVLDAILIAIALISAVLAMYRGFVREVLSIASWVIAAIIAYLFYDDLTPLVGQYVSNDMIAVGIAAAALFFVALIVVSFITMKISDYVIDSKVGFIDRTLGFLYGGVRGILLVVVALIFFNWLVTAENRPDWVVDAKSYAFLSEAGLELIAVLPEDPERAVRSALDRADQIGVPTAETGASRAGEPSSYGSNERQGLDQLIETTGSEEAETTVPAGPGSPAANTTASPAAGATPNSAAGAN